MMKKHLILFFFPLYIHAQDSTNKMVGDTLVSDYGFKVYKDQQLKVGTGTMPDGDFKYIRIAQTSLFQYQGNDRAGVNSANSLQSNARGLQYKVVRIDKYGNKKRGYVYYPIINVGAVRYQVDLDNAIATGEIEVPDEFKPKPKAVLVEIKQPVSTADELIKLKKLYDDGILTKEEFEAQKKKLLEQ